MKKFRLLVVALFVAATATAQNNRQASTSHAGYGADSYSPTVYMIAVEEVDPITPASSCDRLQLMGSATLDYIETHRSGFQQTSKPMFLFASRDNRYSLALGGYIALRASYDMDGISDNLDFIPYAIPLTADYNNRQQLLMDASTSRLYLKGIANSRTLGRIVIYVDTDFRGGAEQSYTPRIRSAYVSMLGLTVGRDVSTFCDLDAAPNTIDFQGPNAYNFNFATMIRYSRSFVDDHLSMGVALEMPSVSGTYSDSYLAMRQRIPDIPIYLQYAWGENRDSHIRASAVFRNMYVRNMVDADNVRLFGWGAQFSGTIKLFPGLRLFMNGVYGKGITPYIQDLTGSGLDFLPDSSGEAIEVMPMWGWQAAAQVNILPRLALSGGYSMVNVERKSGYSFDDEYKRGTYIFGNVIYALSPRCTVGAEYLYGTRKNMDAVKGHANRVNLELKYHF